MGNHLRAVLGGFIATAVMTLAMIPGRLFLGTFFIPELIALQLFSTYDPRHLFPPSGQMTLAILLHVFAGTVLGALLIGVIGRFKSRKRFLISFLYSIALWFIFSSFLLPVLGFGFFAKYFAGIPAAAEASLLVSFLVYGFILPLFRLKNS